MKVTAALLKRLAPNARAERLAAIEKYAPAVLWKYGITTRLRMAHFFAQLAHESNNFNASRESANYSQKTLGEFWDRGTWRKYFNSRASMVAMAGRGQELFNTVYANRMGNGPKSSGDGYRYRGGGLPQITGKDGYAAMEKITGRPFVRNPDLVTQDENLLLVGAAFWRWKRIDQVADNDDLLGVTKRWNGGTIGLADRRARLTLAKKLFTEDLDEPVAAVVTSESNNAADEAPEHEEFDHDETPPDGPDHQPSQPEHAGDDYPRPPENKALIVEAKKKLDLLGYHEFGLLNEEFGGRTVAAIAAYKLDRGMTGPAEINDALMNQLNSDVLSGWKRPMREERANAQVKDLAPYNETLKTNWWTRFVAWITGVGAGFWTIIQGIGAAFHDFKDNYIDPYISYLSDVPSWLWGMIFAGIAFAVLAGLYKSDNTVVKSFQEGRLLR